MKFTPSYLTLYKSGGLETLADKLEEMLHACRLCPHHCGVDRFAGERGVCNSGSGPIVSSHTLHFGEEQPLVGSRWNVFRKSDKKQRSGSGTIFFTNCNLKCMYCQNYDISHLGYGSEITCKQLAGMMLSLQQRGACNINLVTPTHMIFPIVKALLEAVPQGLRLPLVYNCGGYEDSEIIALLEGVFDIFMPDMKYSDNETAAELSGAPDYPEKSAAAVKEMFRQVGDLEMDEDGVAVRGLLIRHLVLPENLAGSYRVIDFLSGLSKDTYINIMDQYHPAFRAAEHSLLRRRPSREEVEQVVRYAYKCGLQRIDGRASLEK